jgi:hypothetical protein
MRGISPRFAIHALLALAACSGADKDPGSGSDKGGATDSGSTDSGAPPTQLRFNWVNLHGEDADEAWTDPDAWTAVRSKTDALSWYIDAANADSRGNVTSGAEFALGAGIKVAVEAGGTLSFVNCDDQTGEDSAALELAKLHAFYEAGSQVDFLTLDGPLSRTLATGRNGNCGFDLDTAVAELVDYFVAVHTTNPEIQIGILTNFPNWTYGGIAAYQCATKDHGDYKVALEAMITALAAVGEAPAYIMADNPYNYLIGTQDSNCHEDPTAVDWAGRLVALERQVQDHGIPFALIYNSEDGGSTSNALFHDQTVAMVELHQSRGGDPDIRHIESWYEFPDNALPETEANSFANTVLDAWAVMTSRH